MTKPHNRLISDGGQGRSPSTTAHGAPTNIDEYCAWLNANERRPGRWVIVEHQGRRVVDFRTNSGTGEWLRTRGLMPKIGRAA